MSDSIEKNEENEITRHDIKALVTSMQKIISLNIDQITSHRQLIALMMPSETNQIAIDIPGLPGKLGDRQPTPVELQCFLIGINSVLKHNEVIGNLDDDIIRAVFKDLGLPMIECYTCDEPSIFSLCENVDGRWYCSYCAEKKKKDLEKKK